MSARNDLSIRLAGVVELVLRAVSKDPPLRLRRRVTLWDPNERRIEWEEEPVIDAASVGRDLAPFKQDPAWTELLDALRRDERARAHVDDFSGIWNDEPERYWHTFVTPLLFALLRDGTPSLSDASIGGVVATLIQELETERTVQCTLRPLLNLTLEKARVEFGPGVLLRELTILDLERWADVERQASSHLLDVRAVLETTYNADLGLGMKNASEDQDRAEALVLALGLVSNADVAAVFAQMRHTGVLGGHGGRLSPGALPPRHFAEGVIGERAVPEIVRFAERLADASTRSQVDFPLRRWRDAMLRGRADDRLVDHWIALESLFTRDARSETAYRSALRIAALLGETGAERAAIYSHVRESYRCRSAVVHAGDLGKFDLQALTTGTRDWHRRTMLRILEQGPFDPERMEMALLRR